jgi:DNA-binding transcriptional regulator LsrR (DeoR family)
MNKPFELLVSIAKNYYVDSIPQSEIAKLYNISRPTVAAILKECKEKGIVEIRINDTSPFSSPVAEQLKNNYGLTTACIVPNETDYALTLYKVCFQAAAYFQSLLEEGIRVGISWGTSLYHMIRQITPTIVPGCEVVQLMGGLGGSALYYDGSELARILSDKLDGQSFPFLSPLLVKSEELKRSLLSEPGIRDTYQKTKMINVALLGIGSEQVDYNALVHSGYLTQGEVQEITDAGSCGHICGYHFNTQGRFLDETVNKRIVGIDLDDLARTPRRIGIASGKHKTKAVLACLRGGLITDLFTDENTALQVLSLYK